MSAAPLDMQALRQRLLKDIPESRDWNLEWRAELGSTNACLLAEPPARAWRVLAAGWQSGGRGRHGRTWICAPGDGLLVSLACPAPPGEGSPALLGHWAALALLEALEPLLEPGRLRWKWPNDILALDDDGTPAKLAGFLVQTQTQGSRIRAVIGMGLNLLQRQFPADLLQPATSLARLAARDTDAESCLARWLLALWRAQELLARPGELLERLARHDGCSGRRLRFVRQGQVEEAELLGYARDGGIHLRTAAGEGVHHDGELRLLV